MFAKLVLSAAFAQALLGGVSVANAQSKLRGSGSTAFTETLAASGVDAQSKLRGRRAPTIPEALVASGVDAQSKLRGRRAPALTKTLVSSDADARSKLRGRRSPAFTEDFAVFEGPRGDEDMDERITRPLQARSLTIVNDCADDITHFQATYNSAWDLSEDGQTYQLQYDSMSTIPILSGERITVTGVRGSELDFYALNAQYDRSKQTWDVCEVAATPTESPIWRNVEFNDGGETLRFAWYREEIGDDMLVELCGSTPPPTCRSASRDSAHRRFLRNW